MSDTPLYDALSRRAGRETLRFHMPGHKGYALYRGLFAETARYDFTELSDTGDLYAGVSPIADSERITARALGAAQAFYLTGGSTQGVFTAVSLCCGAGSVLLCDRASHRSLCAALALADVSPAWMVPERDPVGGFPTGILPEQVEVELKKNPAAAAVFITSPLYHGAMSRIREIAEIVHARGRMLIVDEAHGAHLPFIGGYEGSVRAGADVAVCSFHKTLPALGQAAVLSAGSRMDPARIRKLMSLTGSSSPSYPIMLSIELARAYMQGEGGQAAQENAQFAHRLKEEINRRGVFRACGDDPLRLTVVTAAGGLSGTSAAAQLEQRFGIACEMADSRSVVCILSPCDTPWDLSKLAEAFSELEKSAGGLAPPLQPQLPKAEIRRTPRAALFAPQAQVPLKNCAGRVCAACVAPSPPGIPVCAPGELISAGHIAYLTAAGMSEDTLIDVCE